MMWGVRVNELENDAPNGSGKGRSIPVRGVWSGLDLSDASETCSWSLGIVLWTDTLWRMSLVSSPFYSCLANFRLWLMTALIHSLRFRARCRI